MDNCKGLMPIWEPITLFQLKFHLPFLYFSKSSSGLQKGTGYFNIKYEANTNLLPCWQMVFGSKGNI